MDISMISTAYEGLKAGKNILKDLYDIKVEADAKERIDAVMSKLGDAQDALFSMREELFRLQAENVELKGKVNDANIWNDKISQYELVTTDGGAVVYSFKGTPNHYICPSCKSKKLIEILQDDKVLSGKFSRPGCNAKFPIKTRKESGGIAVGTVSRW